MKKRFLSTIMATIMILSLLPMSAFATAPSGIGKENAWDVSANGDGSVYAYLTANGETVITEDGEESAYTLTFAGSGAMKKWASGLGVYPADAPWYTGGYLSKITHVVIEDGVTNISDYALGNLENMKTLTLGKDVSDIGIGPFAGKQSWTSISVDADNLNLKVMDDVLFSADGTTIYASANDKTAYQVPDGVTTIYRTAFCGNDKLKTIDFNQVTSIDTYAFLDAGLVDVYVPSTVTTMGTGVFRTPTIERVEFYAPTLPTQTFLGCSNLKEVVIGSTVTSIGSTPFHSCGAIETVYYDAPEITSGYIFNYATFSNAKLTIGSNVKSIPANFLANAPDEAFSELIIEDGEPLTIGNAAFMGSTNITALDDSYGRITSIGNQAFRNTGLTGTLVLGSGIESIGHASFKGTSIEKLIIQGSETGVSISGAGANTNGAFSELATLTTVIGNNVKAVGWGAFYNSSNLVAVDLSKSGDLEPAATTFYQSSFKGIAEGSVIYVNDIKNLFTTYHYDNTKTSLAVTNGGTFPEDVTFTAGTLATPMKDGYQFDGWYTTNGTEDSDDGWSGKTEDNQATAGTTYYAKWVKSADYSIPEGSESVVLDEQTYGYQTAPSATVTITGPSGAEISRVESSNSAFSASRNGLSVTITADDSLDAHEYSGTIYIYTAGGTVLHVDVSLAVKKADSSVSVAPSANTLTYTGTAQALVTAGTANGGTMMYSLDGQNYTSFSSIPVGSDSGSYTLYYKVQGDKNHNDTTAQSISVVINQAAPIVTLADKSAAYTGSAISIDDATVTLVNDETYSGTITYTYYSDAACTQALAGAPSAVGTYYVKASIAASGNYKAAESDVATLEIYRQSSSSSPTRYTVTVEDMDNGSVTSSHSRASRGTRVTLTVSPDEGYVLDELVVLDANGDEIELTQVSETRYTFTMPRGTVTIEAAFVEGEEPGHACPSENYDDLSTSAWYHKAVDYMLENGMMAGVSATQFDPEGTLDRAMLVQILWAMAGRPAAVGSEFDDVAAGAWYHDAVVWAAGLGIVGGYGDGSFGPEDPITREQLALILYQFARTMDYDLSATAGLSGYADAGSVSGWAEEALSWAVGAGLISGKDGGVLDPTGTATRAEVAVILMNFCENIAE